MRFMMTRTSPRLEPMLAAAAPGALATPVAPAADPFVYRCGDFVLRLLSGLSGMAAYLAIAMAAFAAACAGYAKWWIPFDTGAFGEQFLQLSLDVLYFTAAPLLLLTCLFYLPWGLWRAAWQRTSVFEEKRLHPALVAIVAVGLMGVTYRAHMSLDGDWHQLPGIFTQVLDLPGTQAAVPVLPARYVHTDAPQSPASMAIAGEAGLSTVSSDAARLRVVQLAENGAHRAAATSGIPSQPSPIQ